MAICLNFFPPSAKFQTYLEGYMNRHRDPGFDFPEVVKWPIHVQISHYATVSCKRLERIGTNGKKPPRKPTIEEIDQARVKLSFENYRNKIFLKKYFTRIKTLLFFFFFFFSFKYLELACLAIR